MITYDLWWGDSVMCMNFPALSILLREVEFRMNGTFDMQHSVKWFYSNTDDVRAAIELKNMQSGVLMIGLTQRAGMDGYVIPARAYQILWREVDVETCQS